MKVKHLIEEINRCKKEYADFDFLEWDVYTEQLGVGENTDFKKEFGNTYEHITDEDGWTYVITQRSGDVAWCTKMPQDKVFTLNVNF